MYNNNDFQKTFKRKFFNTIIEYGIIKGNNNILFIKPGQDGSLRGYKDKYLNLAFYINQKYGYTVICSNNPYDGINNPLEDGIEVIKQYVKENNFDDYKIYYYGNSNGAVIGARYCYLYQNIKRLLLINPPLFVNFHKIEDGIKNFKEDKITFIYGSLDPSNKFVGLLDVIKNEKISYYIIDGEDHNLSKGNVSIIELVDKYLIN